MSRYFTFCFLVFIWCGQSVQAQTLSSHAGVNVTGQTWSYTLFNDEPANSSNYLTAYYLTVQAPFTVTGTPTGWAYTSDNATSVYWYNTDVAEPYPHDVAPGASLGGFSIQSLVSAPGQQALYQVQSWDHIADAQGPNSNPATVLVPSAITPVPEASTGTSLGFGLVALGFGLRLKACKRKNTIR